jgi:hypothetical protein
MMKVYILIALELGTRISLYVSLLEKDFVLKSKKKIKTPLVQVMTLFLPHSDNSYLL